MPDYDVVLVPNFLHHFNVAACARFLRRVHAALRPRGGVVIVEFVSNEDRITPSAAATFSLVMLGATPEGDMPIDRFVSALALRMRPALHSGMNKAKILVLDDDPKVTAAVSFVLKRYGDFLVRVENRSFAIPAALEFSPDLIVIDADMPGDEGGDPAADLRELPPFAETPFIFLSALMAGSGNARTGEVFLAKPVDATLLVATARRLLSPAPTQTVAPRRRFLARFSAEEVDCEDTDGAGPMNGSPDRLN